MIFSYYFFSISQLFCLIILLLQIIKLNKDIINSYLTDQDKYYYIKNKMLNFENNWTVKIDQAIIRFRMLVAIKAGFYRSFNKLRGYFIYSVLSVVKSYYKPFCSEMDSWIVAKVFLVKTLAFDILALLSLLIVAKLYTNKMQLGKAWGFFLAGLILIGIINYLPIDVIKQRKLKHQKEVAGELPDFIIKVILLINAGLTTINAVQEVAKTKQSLLYRFMQLVANEYYQGNKLHGKASYQGLVLTKDIVKFLSILEQDSILGGDQVIEQLLSFSKDVKHRTLQQAKRQGQLGSSKLLLPLLITFIGIMLMIVAPVFMSII